MKKIILCAISSLILQMGLAQAPQKEKDTTVVKEGKRDTIRIGGLIIITKRNKNSKPKDVEIITNGDSTAVAYKRKPKKRSNVTTNWISWDIGYNNFKDETNYSSADVTSMLKPVGTQTAPGANDFKLNTGKSVNFNLWIFTQKLNVLKHVVGLKYGLGLEYYNFRFKTPLTFKDESPSFIIRDSVAFSKNKLTVKYLTVPLMLTLNPTGKGGFSISGGMSVSYKYGAHTKQKSDARGKDKDKGEFGLNPWKIAIVGDIGYNKFRLYGSYSLTPLHEKGLNFTPYTVGLRFSQW
jgi:hypothetical protein